MLRGGTPSTPTRRSAAGEILHQYTCTLPRTPIARRWADRHKNRQAQGPFGIRGRTNQKSIRLENLIHKRHNGPSYPESPRLGLLDQCRHLRIRHVQKRRIQLIRAGHRRATPADETRRRKRDHAKDHDEDRPTSDPPLLRVALSAAPTFRGITSIYSGTAPSTDGAT